MKVTEDEEVFCHKCMTILTAILQTSKISPMMSTETFHEIAFLHGLMLFLSPTAKK